MEDLKFELDDRPVEPMLRPETPPQARPSPRPQPPSPPGSMTPRPRFEGTVDDEEGRKFVWIALALWVGWVAVTVYAFVAYEAPVAPLEAWLFRRLGHEARWGALAILHLPPLVAGLTLGRKPSVSGPIALALGIAASLGVAKLLVGSYQPPKISVTHPGAEPKTVLRHDFTKAVPVVIDVHLDYAQFVNARRQDVPLDLSLELEPRHVSRGGALRYDFRVRSVTVSDPTPTTRELADMIQSRFAGASEARGWAVVSAQGDLETVRLQHAGAILVDDALGLLREVRWIIGRLHLPLPDTPVGVGAAWQVTQAIDIEGLELQREARYSLLEVRDRLLAIETLGTERLLEDVKLNPPGTGTVMLLEAEERFRGEASVRLGAIDTQADMDTDFHEAYLVKLERHDGELKVVYRVTPRET
ncbi:MAG: hypothetical protein R3B72_48915 [Polyangiaceae bacterium]